MPPKAKAPKAAPKKAGGKGAAAAGKATPAAAAAPPPDPVDGQDVWLATDALQKTKAMRNYFQLERDRIIGFWDISKKELEDTKEQLRQREHDEAELQERHAVEKRVFKQKMRHLLYENQLELAKLKEEGERALLSKLDEYRQKENHTRLNIRDVKLANRELEVTQQKQHRELIAQQDREIAEQQNRFEMELREIHTQYEQAVRDLRDEMDHARREEIRLVEQRKDRHVNELRDVHERTFKEMKDYYSEITSQNLETIRTLKDEVYARKRTEAHNEKAMYEVAQRNKKLTEPLAALHKQKRELEAELANYAADAAMLQQLKGQATESDQALKTLGWEHEVLSQRFAKLKEDRDNILAKYHAMLQDIQRKSIFRRVIVQKKLELVQGQLEGRDAQLTELLRQANINPEDVKEIEHKVHDLVSEKDKTIEDLQELLRRATDKCEDVVASYEQYLDNNSVGGLTMS